MLRALRSIVLLALLAFPYPAGADDLMIDGVPLPPDVTTASTATRSSLQRWSGVWVGLWGDSLKHILVVEDVAESGKTPVVYAIGDNPNIGLQRRWLRIEGVISGSTLKVAGKSFSATYEMTSDGGLKAQYEQGSTSIHARMIQADLAALKTPDAAIAWTGATSEFVTTELVEDGKPVRLEVVMFRPAGTGPFPLAVINHGSTGNGRNPKLFTQTWSSAELADVLNERGWMVAFPQRRGRGKSDGLYDEGFAEVRSLGYDCDVERTLRGADRALADIDAAISALRRRQDVAPAPVLLGGLSRGGILSIAYAGMHPTQVAGVINFAGGWLGEGCSTATTVNHQLFERGATFRRPTLWIYGQNDPFYSMAHSRSNFAAFEQAGGQGQFLEFDAPAGQGHFVIARPNLWSGTVEAYLNSLRAAAKD